MRRVLMAWGLGLCVIGAQAQVKGLEDRSGEATLASCLVRPAVPPTYPAEALAGRRDGFYRVELTFGDAQSPPGVKVVFGRGLEDLRQAAEQYAQQFRLPCLAAGQKVVALQEVAFNAGEVQVPRPLNLPLPADAQHAACLQRSEVPFHPGMLSDRPLRRELATSNVLLELSFTAPDRPPQVKVLYSSVDRAFRDEYVAYVETFRVPCLIPGERFVIEQALRLQSAGKALPHSTDLNLANLLSMVRNVEARPVSFDLGTMGCPFQLNFHPRRPTLANRVTEIGDANPNRRSLIAWLEELEMVMTNGQREKLLGVVIRIDVPCAVIKLG